jgi:hypothetical protein
MLLSKPFHNKNKRTKKLTLDFEKDFIYLFNVGDISYAKCNGVSIKCVFSHGQAFGISTFPRAICKLWMISN